MSRLPGWKKRVVVTSLSREMALVSRFCRSLQPQVSCCAAAALAEVTLSGAALSPPANRVWWWGSLKQHGSLLCNRAVNEFLNTWRRTLLNNLLKHFKDGESI